MKTEFFVSDVAYAWYKRYPEGYLFRQKSRKYYGLTLLLSGEMDFVLGEEHHTLTPGTILLQEQRDKYHLRVTSPQGAEYIVISYLAEPMETLLSLLPGRIFHTPRVPKYRDLFEDALRIGTSFAPCTQARLCAAVQEILCCIIQEHSRTARGSTRSTAQKAMLFLEQNFSLPISCSLLAQEVGVSPSHLRSIFKTEYGTSPIRALNEIRIRRAKTMIKSGIFTLQEVAAACGFQNEYYFSRVFKEFVGTSPGKY